jgi:uncharacterized protein
MEMSGEQSIPVPQARVWEALNDPEVLKACIPGCDSIEKVSDNEYRVAMTAAVGPVKARFAGKLALGEVNPPTSYTLAFEGSGGAAGFGKGGAKVALAPEGAGTKLSYTANAQVGGKLAQVGSRLIDGVARKMANDFFTRFKALLVPEAAAEAPSAMLAADGTRAAVPARPKSSGEIWMTPVWLFLGAFVLTLAAIWFL